ncbi:hypothetical protein [uncultured Lactobacillus sp.]|uniref:hypothetical protein n=1 Tax=uncultured Lactobacillus sp. TaxID=153152 RepID=UPI0026212B44|nr:hypothetical protein [uncultured Lactobacillus sp.]
MNKENRLYLDGINAGRTQSTLATLRFIRDNKLDRVLSQETLVELIQTVNPNWDREQIIPLIAQTMKLKSIIDEIDKYLGIASYPNQGKLPLYVSNASGEFYWGISDISVIFLPKEVSKFFGFKQNPLIVDVDIQHDKKDSRLLTVSEALVKFKHIYRIKREIPVLVKENSNSLLRFHKINCLSLYDDNEAWSKNNPISLDIIEDEAIY